MTLLNLTPPAHSYVAHLLFREIHSHSDADKDDRDDAGGAIAEGVVVERVIGAVGRQRVGLIS